MNDMPKTRAEAIEQVWRRLPAGRLSCLVTVSGGDPIGVEGYLAEVDVGLHGVSMGSVRAARCFRLLREEPDDEPLLVGNNAIRASRSDEVLRVLSQVAYGRPDAWEVVTRE